MDPLFEDVLTEEASGRVGLVMPLRPGLPVCPRSLGTLVLSCICVLTTGWVQESDASWMFSHDPATAYSYYVLYFVVGPSQLFRAVLRCGPNAGLLLQRGPTGYTRVVIHPRCLRVF